MKAPWILERAKPVNWVKRRAECDARAIFDALREQIGRDIAEAHKTDICARLEIKDDRPGCFLVTVVGGNSLFGSLVRFERATASITVESKDDSDDLAITWRWDDEAVACRLMMDGQETDLWRISQKALSRLIFA